MLLDVLETASSILTEHFGSSSSVLNSRGVDKRELPIIFELVALI